MSRIEDSSYQSFKREIDTITYTVVLVDIMPSDSFVENGANQTIYLNIDYTIPARMEGYEEFVLNSILMAVALKVCGSCDYNRILRYFSKIRLQVSQPSDGEMSIDDWIDDICGFLPE